MNFEELEHRYRIDPAFNKMVNCFEGLISEHGFMPSEIREALFYTQWMIEMHTVREIVRSREDWEKIEDARQLLKKKFGDIK